MYIRLNSNNVHVTIFSNSLQPENANLGCSLISTNININNIHNPSVLLVQTMNIKNNHFNLRGINSK